MKAFVRHAGRCNVPIAAVCRCLPVSLIRHVALWPIHFYLTTPGNLIRQLILVRVMLSFTRNHLTFRTREPPTEGDMRRESGRARSISHPYDHRSVLLPLLAGIFCGRMHCDLHFAVNVHVRIYVRIRYGCQDAEAKHLYMNPKPFRGLAELPDKAPLLRVFYRTHDEIALKYARQFVDHLTPS